LYNEYARKSSGRDIVAPGFQIIDLFTALDMKFDLLLTTFML